VEDAAMAGALAQARTAVVASFCLEGGILSGKYLDQGAEGRAAEVLGQPRFASAVGAAADLAGLAARLDTSPAALALAFPLAGVAAVSLLRRLSPAERAELLLIGAS
jgi:aryl-alcohol dehydrogenase-like predicted oxidoreductase